MKDSSEPEITWFTRFKVALAALAFAAAAIGGTAAMDAPDTSDTEETAKSSVSVSIDWRGGGDDGGVSYSRSVTWS